MLFSDEGDGPSLSLSLSLYIYIYDGPLLSCRAVTCWRGAPDVFKYSYSSNVKIRLLTEQCTRHAHSKSLSTFHVLPISHHIDRFALGSAFVRFREKHQIQKYIPIKVRSHKIRPYWVWLRPNRLMRTHTHTHPLSRLIRGFRNKYH